LLNRAVQALQSADHPDLQLLCSLLLSLSSVERALADSRCLDHLREVIKIATEHGFGKVLVMAAQQLSIDPRTTGMPEARSFLEAAEKLLPEEDKQERAMVLAHLARTPPYCMNARRVNELLTRAEALARESKSFLALATVLRVKLFLTGGPADAFATQAIVDELEKLPNSEHDLWAMPSIDIRLCHVITCIQRGDQEALHQAIDDFDAVIRKHKSVELQWHRRRMDIVLRMNAGELVGLNDAISDLRERAERLVSQMSRMICDLDRGVLLSLTTDVRPFAAEAKNHLRIEETDSQSAWAMKIQKMTEFGLLLEAEAALRRFPVAMIEELPTDCDYLAVLAHLAVGGVATGATEYVEALYHLLKPYPQYYAAGISLHCEGSVSYFLGILARALGRDRDAIAHLEEALVQNERFGLKVHVVRTRYELAHTLANNTTRTARKRARAILKQSQQGARTLGLQRVLDDAERLLAELPSYTSRGGNMRF
jgi:tetratricopeptide (TPR) repeat protein